MLTDPIADMLTRIRNANKAMHERAVMPDLALKEEIARLLKEEGYITRLPCREPTGQDGSLPLDDLLVIDLKYGRNRERVITGPEARLASPGRRIYAREGQASARARRHGHGYPVHLAGPDDEPDGRASRVSAAR